jgi:hypothetical protein
MPIGHFLICAFSKGIFDMVKVKFLIFISRKRDGVTPKYTLNIWFVLFENVCFKKCPNGTLYFRNVPSAD